jgi:hypothetical protein
MLRLCKICVPQPVPRHSSSSRGIRDMHLAAECHTSVTTTSGREGQQMSSGILTIKSFNSCDNMRLNYSIQVTENAVTVTLTVTE